MPKQDVTLVEESEVSDKLTKQLIEKVRLKQRIYNARPTRRVKLDRKAIVAVAKTMLSFEDMASILGCTASHLFDNYATIIHEARNNTKRELATAMMNKALQSGDSRMMIWLSKQHLGYKEAWPEGMQPVSININVTDMP